MEHKCIIINKPKKIKENNSVIWSCILEFDNTKYVLKNIFHNTNINLIGTTIDPVVCLLMPIVLCNGYELCSKYPVDRTLHENLIKLPNAWSKFKCDDKYTDVKYLWNYPITDHKYKMPVEKKKTVSTFTGGIDSFYTMLNKKDEITEWIYINGFDVPLSNKDLFNKVWNSINESKKMFPFIKNIRLISSNIREVCSKISKQGTEWGFFLFGPAIFSIVHIYNDINLTYIPSSYESTMERRNGSHFFTDYLYSSSTLEIKTDGDIDRIEKTRELCDKLPKCLDYLRVCWKNPHNSYNCSRCFKCMRTMYTIYLFDKFNKAITFDQTFNPNKYISDKSALNDPMEKPYVIKLMNYNK